MWLMKLSADMQPPLLHNILFSASCMINCGVQPADLSSLLSCGPSGTNLKRPGLIGHLISTVCTLLAMPIPESSAELAGMCHVFAYRTYRLLIVPASIN